MGGLTQITLAYGTLLSTLFLPLAYQYITNWMALSNRLRDMLWALNKVRDKSPGIELKHEGQQLCC
ncbi:hypothetical protein WDV93_13910 [Pantoea ananatis]